MRLVKGAVRWWWHRLWGGTLASRCDSRWCRPCRAWRDLKITEPWDDPYLCTRCGSFRSHGRRAEPCPECRAFVVYLQARAEPWTFPS